MMLNEEHFDYVKEAKRTELVDIKSIQDRLMDERVIRLLHAVLGMATEVGEFADNMKRFLIYGQEFNRGNMKEELGDQMWYQAIAIDCIRSTIREVQELNIEKLRKRYPERFNEHDAVNRNIDEEQKLFTD